MSIAPQPAGPPAPGPIERAAEASISLGHRIAQGSPAEVRADPTVIAAYLGDAHAVEVTA